MENKFLENYFREIRELISDSSKVINDLIDVKKTIVTAMYGEDDGDDGNKCQENYKRYDETDDENNPIKVSIKVK